MLILMFFAFLAGIVTILSPCILPLLPIILSSGVSGGKGRPLGIVVGFIASFTFFTLFLSTIVRATGVSADVLRVVAVIVIGAFGVSLLFNQTQVFLEQLFSKVANLIPQVKNDSGFLGGILVGLSLGLIWAPCVGPILASVITLAITSTVTSAAFFITLAYSIGTALPMLFITYSGQKLFQKNPWLLKRTSQIQKVFGVVMILTAAGIYLNVDRQFQTFILEKFPQYGAGLTSIEDNTLVREQLERLRNQKAAPSPILKEKGSPAPGFQGEASWINSPPLDLQRDLAGKVVLVDFWTYSCINCIRTFPYLKEWYQKYKDQGFVIVGVHTPEFEFEKSYANVERAVQDFALEYPVVQDNNFKIWSAYKNLYWPAHYLIDKEGTIRYTHFGEGKYLETENAIRTLLDEQLLTESTPEPDTLRRGQSPEIYLGYQRASNYPEDVPIIPEQVVSYQFPRLLSNHRVGLAGRWQVNGESILAKPTKPEPSKLQLRFKARQVHLVMDGPAGSRVNVSLNGQAILPENLTQDMTELGVITIDGPRKYDIIKVPDTSVFYTLELEFDTDVQAFAFTFG